ncbi:hypothetical protein Fmac_012825 [Flemingia macrophylla]|uniref:Uncharacterized protein n=1 Tax=Flemingia macrophylla TaxID=520843 RepID=A0ABD1MRF8_9FABA
MSMSSMISAQGVAVATAMAVSGTVILLALRLQKSLHEMPPPSPPPPPPLRSCISSGRKKAKKKRVHFAKDVVESRRDGEEFRKKIHSFKPKAPSKPGIPANRVALYNGILRDRVAQRLAYSC